MLITEIQELFSELSDILINYELAKVNRMVSTRERHIIGNNLYELVARYCKIGRAIWMDINNVLYESYFLNTKPDKTPADESEDNEIVDETIPISV